MLRSPTVPLDFYQTEAGPLASEVPDSLGQEGQVVI